MERSSIKKKRIKEAQLKPLQELKELKPLKLPGEKDPAQAISICPYCNSAVSQDSNYCQNCKQFMTPKLGNPYPRKVPQRNERYDDFGPKDTYLNKNVALAGKKDKNKKKKKLKDEYISEEFGMWFLIKKCLVIIRYYKIIYVINNKRYTNG